MDCKVVQDSLIEYVLGEVDDSRRDSIREHLATCSGCSDEAHQLKALVGTVQSSIRTDAVAPNDFADRVMTRIPVEFLTVPKAQRRLTFKSKIAIAAVFVVAVMFGFTFRNRFSPVSPASSPMVQLSDASILQAHDDIASSSATLPPPMPDAGNEAAWMTQNADYHVLPVDMSKTGTRISEAGVMPLMGHHVAVWKLMKDGQPMTLIQMADCTTTLPKLVPMPFPKYDRTLLCGNSGSCRIVAWHDRTMTFILVATMPEHDIDSVALATRTV